MKKISIVSIMMLSLLFVFGCDTQTTPSEKAMTKLSARDLKDDYVLWHGRTHYNTETEHMYFYHTASGFTVTFEGTALTIDIHATNTENLALRPCFSVLINDQMVDEGYVIALESPSSTITLIDDLDYGIHTVQLIKRSEARDSMTSITRIETDGTFLPTYNTFDMNILVLGASGVSGNGVFGSLGTPRTTENSSSLHAFPYKTASALNADIAYVASSGWGLKWGFNPTNENGTVNIRSAFEKVGIDDNQMLVDINYDFHDFIPDFIIINLGGNDYNAHISTLSGEARLSAEQSFQEAVIECVTTLNALYPNAVIFWTHTSSNNGLLASTVLSDLDPTRTFVETITIHSPGAFGDPVGSGNHASQITHQRNAALIIERIQARLQD